MSNYNYYNDKESIYSYNDRNALNNKNMVNVKKSCELTNALNNLNSNTTIQFCCGKYDDVTLNIKESILVNNLTLLGDTNPLAGVTFMEGGEYCNTGLIYIPHLSPCIGKGVYKLKFNGIQNKVTVTSNINPNFSDVAPCTTVKILDKNGDLHSYSVHKGCDNELYFNEEICLDFFVHDDCCKDKEADAVKGVAFVLVPHVVLRSNITNILSGVKNLRMVGIYFDLCGELYYGENYSNIENCMFGKHATIYSTAMLSVNRSPNTILGKFVLDEQTHNKFIFNSVLTKNAMILANNCSGFFSNSMFSHCYKGLYLVNNTNLNGSYNLYYQINGISMHVTDGSKLKTPCTIVYFIENSGICDNAKGLVVSDSSIVVTESKEYSRKSHVLFIKKRKGKIIPFDNAICLENHSFFYNWTISSKNMGCPGETICSSDETSKYYYKIEQNNESNKENKCESDNESDNESSDCEQNNESNKENKCELSKENKCESNDESNECKQKCELNDELDNESDKSIKVNDKKKSKCGYYFSKYGSHNNKSNDIKSVKGYYFGKYGSN